MRKSCVRDLDSLLGFHTHKVVRINDRWLGGVYYICLVCVLLYIVGYSVLYNRQYLSKDDIVGSTSVLLKNPPNFSGMAQRPYCGADHVPCRIWDEHDVRYPNQDSDVLLLTSKVTTCEQHLLCNSSSTDCDLSSPYSNPDCEQAGSSSTFFIAGLESFTLQIEHSVSAPDFFAKTHDAKFRAESSEMLGSVVLRGSDGKPQVMRWLLTGETADIFKVDELLIYAGLVGGLDAPLVRDGRAGSTARQGGITVFVHLRYSNEPNSPFEMPGAITYQYEFALGTGEEVLYVPQTATAALSSRAARTLTVRRGVKIVLVQEGELSQFDLHVLLLTLITGMGLLAGAQLAVDLLAVHVMPLREAYYRSKYELRHRRALKGSSNGELNAEVPAHQAHDGVERSHNELRSVRYTHGASQADGAASSTLHDGRANLTPLLSSTATIIPTQHHHAAKPNSSSTASAIMDIRSVD